MSSFAVDASAAGEHGIFFSLRQFQRLFLLSVETRQQAVEDVIIALFVGLRDQARFLQQILLDASAFDGPLTVEVDVDVFAETGRVVIANSPDGGMTKENS